MRTYINNTKEKAATVGFVTTFLGVFFHENILLTCICAVNLLGRRRVTCSAKGRQEDVARDDRQSINYTIQGTASEVFKRALVKLEETRQGDSGSF